MDLENSERLEQMCSQLMYGHSIRDSRPRTDRLLPTCSANLRRRLIRATVTSDSERGFGDEKPNKSVPRVTQRARQDVILQIEDALMMKNGYDSHNMATTPTSMHTPTQRDKSLQPIGRKGCLAVHVTHCLD